MESNLDSHSLLFAKDWLLLGPMWLTIIAACFTFCGVILARIVLAAQGKGGRVKGTAAKILNVVIIFHLLALPAGIGYAYYKAWSEIKIVRTQITLAQRVRLPENPQTGLVWFGTKRLDKTNKGQQWLETEVTASANQQIMIHQIWETVHGLRTQRFPLGAPKTFLPSYNPSEDPQAKAKTALDPESSGQIRKDPLGLMN